LREAKRRGNPADTGPNGWGLPRRFAPRNDNSYPGATFPVKKRKLPERLVIAFCPTSPVCVTTDLSLQQREPAERFRPRGIEFRGM
jgi:hypothetical protein